jgi:lysozyme
MKIMKIGKQGLDLIKRFEGFSAKPYLCPAGVPTIGYGATYYEDGTKVKLTDAHITEERAMELLRNVLRTYEQAVDSYSRDDITQNQFDALVSFSYNVGTQALKNSTLLKRVNANPLDPDIRVQFMRWNKGGGVILKGLTKRRQAEADLYFS